MVDAFRLAFNKCQYGEVWSLIDLRIKYISSHAIFQRVEENVWGQVADLEAVLGYKFQDRSLLVTAMRPRNGTRPPSVPHNDALEYLGDSILEVIAPIFFIEEGRQLQELHTLKLEAVTNLALQAVGLEAGVDQFLLEIDDSTRANHVIARASYEATKAIGGNNFWKAMPCEKELADAVEAIFGAVYLDCGMDFDVMLKLFRKLHWPAVGRYM
jgi:dsRNA-specific ribonuclease